MIFFYISISSKNRPVIDWYSGNNINIWNVIIQDFVYVILGIIIATRLFKYLVKKNIIYKNFIYFLLILIIVQISGDLLFSLIINYWPLNYTSFWIMWFKNYIKKSSFNALFGDTLYVIVWSISYYFVYNYINRFDIKIFIIFLFLFLTSAYSVK